MMLNPEIVREIPERAWSGLKDGSLIQKPGAIYRKHGGIFAHFLASSPEGVQQAAASITGPAGACSAAQQMMGQLTTLAQASMVLSGVNLAVTAAGFAVVCQ